MGRVNKKTEGVFTDIVGDMNEVSSYNEFTNQKDLDKTKNLKVLTGMYKGIINVNNPTFEQLSHLEEIILQLRAIENMDIKVSILRNEYIYVRTPFYRRSKNIKDIRTIIENPEFKGEQVTNLLGNDKFITISKKKLRSMMVENINENISEYKKIYNVENLNIFVK